MANKTYRDRNGTAIRQGDTLLCAVTINQKRQALPFTIHIVKWKSKKLIGDGIMGLFYISEFPPNEMEVLNVNTNLRNSAIYFWENFKGDSIDKAIMRNWEAQEFIYDLFTSAGYEDVSPEGVVAVKRMLKASKIDAAETDQLYSGLEDLKKSIKKVEEGIKDAKKKNKSRQPKEKVISASIGLIGDVVKIVWETQQSWVRVNIGSRYIMTTVRGWPMERTQFFHLDGKPIDKGQWAKLYELCFLSKLSIE